METKESKSDEIFTKINDEKIKTIEEKVDDLLSKRK